MLPLNKDKTIISTLSYYTVERSIDWFQQKHRQSNFMILLYVDAVTTPKHHFPLENIQDMSFKAFSNGTGLFYLHTNQGVFTYGVERDPMDFIKAYRRLKGDQYI
ncbi:MULTISPECIES: hypothetical protein [Sporosarcina]|uniref:Uncharacterized protein n=1 Tax=Sporosarcina contaminans TaxID=633403 RepID=A0ABW3TWK2_9BACL